MIAFISSLSYQVATHALLVYGTIFVLTVIESLALVGLTVPGTTSIIILGVLAGKGIFSLIILIIICSLGGMSGDLISFYLGKTSYDFLSKKNPFFTSNNFKNGINFFHRHGYLSIVIARFVGPLRPIIPFVVGMMKMPVQKFLPINFISTAASSTTFILVGYFLGSAWRHYARTAIRIEIGVAILFLTLAGLYFWRRKKRRASNP